MNPMPSNFHLSVFPGSSPLYEDIRASANRLLQQISKSNDAMPDVQVFLADAHAPAAETQRALFPPSGESQSRYHLFLSSERSLESWVCDPKLKENEFYIRVITAYGLGEFVP